MDDHDLGDDDDDDVLDVRGVDHHRSINSTLNNPEVLPSTNVSSHGVGQLQQPLTGLAPPPQQQRPLLSSSAAAATAVVSASSTSAATSLSSPSLNSITAASSVATTATDDTGAEHQNVLRRTTATAASFVLPATYNHHHHQQQQQQQQQRLQQQHLPLERQFNNSEFGLQAAIDRLSLTNNNIINSSSNSSSNNFNNQPVAVLPTSAMLAGVGGGGGISSAPEHGGSDDTSTGNGLVDHEDVVDGYSLSNSSNIFGAFGGSGAEESNMYSVDCSPPITGWSVVTTTNGGTPPSARSLHAAAILNGVMYIFGGYSGQNRVNTFHAYSFAEKRWSPVLPSAGSAGPPSPRDRHVAFAYGNSIFIQGGFDGTSRISDFWSFDLSAMSWREVVGTGRAPSPRHSHSAVVYRHSVFLYGGYDGSYKSDLHEFDFDTNQWNLVPTTGRRPRARYRATTVVHKDYMILYGGHDGTRHLSDTHVFDFETRSWSSLSTEGKIPVPRDSHIAVIHANSMYIFGGSSGAAMNDLHELQLPPNPSTTAAKWRAVTTAADNKPRCRFCHIGVVHNEALFVFGGYDGNIRLNDFVRFDFAVYDLSFEVPPSSLVAELRSLVDDETMSDVTFLVDGHSVYAHKLMLMRCSYFRALFLGEMMESKMSVIRIELVSHAIFLKVLEYLYTDQVRIPLDSAMELFEAADLFCIPRLKTMCEKRMLQSINIENAASIFHASDVHSALALRNKAKKYILSHFEQVSKTASFEDMGRRNIDLLFELLQSR